MDSRDSNDLVAEQITAFPGSARADFAPPSELVQRYDFRNPITFSEKERRKLRQEHEAYANSLAALLSIYFRLEFGLQVSKLETIPFHKFTASIPNPAQVTLFKVEGLQGTCLLEMSPRLGLTMVERLMGGPGQPANVTRDLTEIEVALLDQVVQIVLNEWCTHWANKGKFKAAILSHETNPTFLRSAGSDTLMFVVGMEANMCDCVEQLHIVFPFTLIEPLISDQAANESRAEARSREHQMRWSPEFGEIDINLSAEWKLNHLPARRVASLQVGEVIQLNSMLTEQVQVRLGAIPKFNGKLGMQGNKWAVQLTQKQTKSV
jgi:flagellar motor switch protein FliM